MSITYEPFIKYIEKRGLSVNSFVEMEVITDTTARHIRNGRPINIKHIDAICQHLNIPIEQVVRITKD